MRPLQKNLPEILSELHWSIWVKLTSLQCFIKYTKEHDIALDLVRYFYLSIYSTDRGIVEVHQAKKIPLFLGTLTYLTKEINLNSLAHPLFFLVLLLYSIYSQSAFDSRKMHTK